MVKIYSNWIIHCCLDIYLCSSRYYRVHGNDISWKGINQSIFFCICWQSLSQVWSGPLPRLASLYVFVRNWSLYCWFLIWCGFLHRWFLGIVFFHLWRCWMFLWFWDILSGCTTFIWWINRCRWWIILLIMHKHRSLSFYKTTHGLPVAGWDKISIMIIDSCEGSIKLNMKM